MTNTYTILSTMENVSMVCDNYGIMYAMVDGKLYDAYNGKPVNHGGRQLRENSRNLIDSMRSDAYGIMETLKNERETERQNAISNAVEKALAENASKPSESPSKPSDGFGMLESMLMDTVAKYATEKAMGDILPAVKEKVLAEFGPLPQTHIIKIPDMPDYKSSGELYHKDFDRILGILKCPTKHGIYLYGPAGTGKSYIAKQISKVFNIAYHCATSVVDDVTIKGYKDAAGIYHDTEFYRAFVNGGVFLLDELDGSDPSVLVMLNEALANGYFPFPDGIKDMHPEFYCIAAGNTVCNGATAEYTGRYALDKSTMDRFAFIEVQYQEEIEKAMSYGDESLIKFAHDYREVVESAGIHSLFTYRGIKRLAEFSTFMEKQDAIRIGLLQGMDISDIKVISLALDSTNEWEKAFISLTEGR